MKNNRTPKLSIVFTATAIALSFASAKAVSSSPSLLDQVLYSSSFQQSSNNAYGGSTYNYTPSANGGTVVKSGTVNSNGYGTSSGTGTWATSANGQDGWMETGVVKQGGPGVIFRNGNSAYKYNPAALVLGGDSFYSADINNPQTYPQSATTYLTQSQYSGTGTNAIHFDSTMLIYANAANNNGDWDTLGWTIQNSAGANLLSINFNNVDVGNGLDGGNWQLSATAYGSTNRQILALPAAAWSTIANNALTHIGFNIYNIGQTNETIQVLQYQNTSSTNLPTTTSGGTMSILGTDIITGGEAAANAGGTSVAKLAATWTLADTTSTQSVVNADGSISTGYNDYADNSLLMYSMLISVPEPKTWVLLGISGLIMVVALRRKTS